MLMPSVFEPETANKILGRINQLQPDSIGQWGKMNVAQMMAHVSTVLELGTGDRHEKPKLIFRLLGPLMKKMVLNTKPYKPNLPTGKNFIMANERSFDIEKERLLQVYNSFVQSAATIEGKEHPIFGKMTAAEWGFSQWKHLDHHLRQFGV